MSLVISAIDNHAYIIIKTVRPYMRATVTLLQAVSTPGEPLLRCSSRCAVALSASVKPSCLIPWPGLRHGHRGAGGGAGRAGLLLLLLVQHVQQGC